MERQIVNENAYALILSITKDLEPDTALKTLGIEVPYEKAKNILDNQEEFIKIYYYRIGMTMKDIGKLYDVSESTVRNFMIKNKMQTRAKGVNMSE